MTIVWLTLGAVVIIALAMAGADRMFNHVDIPRPRDPTAPDPTAPGNGKSKETP